MTENEIARELVDACYHVHKELGPGLFESVYEECIFFEIGQRGIAIERQVEIPVFYKGLRMEQGFRADLIIDKKVVLEIKSIETLHEVHFKQVLTYLRLTKIKLGLLVNFNENLIKDGIHRVVNNL